MSVNKLKYLLPIALLCCDTFVKNDTRQYNIYISNFSEEHHKIIRQSFNDWTVATDGEVFFTEVEHINYPNLITVRLVPQKEILPGAWAYREWIINSTNSNIYVSNEIDDQYLAQLMRHEIGHALGMKHTVQGTIMCFSLSCASENITCEDVKYFCKIWNCNAKEKVICQ